MSNTLEYYNKNSKEYFKNTVNVDLSNIYLKFIDKLATQAKILDLGCGSGRDSLYFIKKGYKVTAIDGSNELAKLAEELIGQPIIVSEFEKLILKDKYNGIWACSTLLHLNEEELLKLLNKLENSLLSNGSLYMSFKYGENEYIDDKGRYFNCYTEETIEKLINKVSGLEVRESFKTIDVIPGRGDVIWLNILCIKRG